MRILSLLVLFVLGTTPCAVVAQEAPLGLTWGMSAADAKTQGGDLKEFTSTDFGKTFLAMKLERAVADQEATLLSFGFSDKLWRIVVTSRDFSNDPAGSGVQARYHELSSVLSEKYGNPTKSHRLGGSIYSEPKYFIAGIRGGNSTWFSNFETPTVFIQLGILATDSSTSSWRIIYENKALRKDFEACFTAF